MERLRGTTFDQWVTHCRPSPRAIVELMLQIAEPLAYAHEQGLVHRDVKPANVFVIPPDDGGTDVKLLDFGLCRSDVADRVTRTGFLVGTPFYMSPERALEGDDGLVPTAAPSWSVFVDAWWAGNRT